MVVYRSWATGLFFLSSCRLMPVSLAQIFGSCQIQSNHSSIEQTWDFVADCGRQTLWKRPLTCRNPQCKRAQTVGVATTHDRTMLLHMRTLQLVLLRDIGCFMHDCRRFERVLEFAHRRHKAYRHYMTQARCCIQTSSPSTVFSCIVARDRCPELDLCSTYSSSFPYPRAVSDYPTRLTS